MTEESLRRALAGLLKIEADRLKLYNQIQDIQVDAFKKCGILLVAFLVGFWAGFHFQKIEYRTVEPRSHERVQ